MGNRIYNIPLRSSEMPRRNREFLEVEIWSNSVTLTRVDWCDGTER